MGPGGTLLVNSAGEREGEGDREGEGEGDREGEGVGVPAKDDGN